MVSIAAADDGHDHYLLFHLGVSLTMDKAVKFRWPKGPALVQEIMFIAKIFLVWQRIGIALAAHDGMIRGKANRGIK